MTTHSIQKRAQVARVDLPDHHHEPADETGARPILELLDDVKVSVEIRLGRSTMTIKALIALQAGAVVELDRSIGEPVDVLLNGKTIAHGEIVAIDGQFGIRVLDVAVAH